MTDVKCKVQTCYYWGNNDICKADSIMVDNNSVSGRRGIGMEVGELDIDAGNRSRNRKAGERSFATPTEAGDLDARIDAQSGISTRSGTDIQSGRQGGSQAHSSDETLCSTFRPKGSEPKR